MQLPDHSIERHELTFQCPEKCTSTVYKNFSSFDRHLCRLHDGVTICHYDWHSFIKSETVKIISEDDFISNKKGQFVKVVAKPRTEVSLTWGANMKAQRIIKRTEDAEIGKSYKIHTRKWLIEKKKKEAKRRGNKDESFVLSPRIGERARRKEVRDRSVKSQEETHEASENNNDVKEADQNGLEEVETHPNMKQEVKQEVVSPEQSESNEIEDEASEAEQPADGINQETVASE